MPDQDTQQTSKSISNVAKATTVGVVGGGSAVGVISWASAVIEAKYGVPAYISATVLGTVGGFLARWAAKLEPHE